MNRSHTSDEWRCDGKLLRDIQSRHFCNPKPIQAAGALIKIVEKTLHVTDEDYEPNEQEKQELESLGSVINKISCKLSSNCSESQDSFEQRTLKLLESLEQFNWEAKIAITLAGFATYFAEYFLINEVYTTNPMAKGLLQLKGIGQKNTGENRDEIVNFASKVTGIIKVILKLMVIQNKHPTISIGIIDLQSASYWIIYALLIRSSKIPSQGDNTENVDSKIKKIEVMCSYFSSKLKEFEELEEEEKIKAEYEHFRRIFGEAQANNVEILKILLGCEESQELVCSMDGNEVKKIKLTVLKESTVFVLLSSLNINAYGEEVSLIKAFCKKKDTKNQYHIVWLPIGNKEEEKYDYNVGGMPWYYLGFESVKEEHAICLDRYARKKWGFNEKPMLMVLNNGQVVHHDALSLMHMWGHLGFPFRKQTDLWREHGNNLGIQFILDYLHNDLITIIPEKDPNAQYVCVFGGKMPQKPGKAENGNSSSEGQGWFANLAGNLMKATYNADIKLKMAYLSAKEDKAEFGRSIKTIVQKDIKDTQYKEKMSYVEVEKMSTKFFWSRAKSIALQLTIQKKNGTLDANMEALLKITRSILQFNVQSTAWVAIGQLGTNEMIFYDAERFSTCLQSLGNDTEKSKKWKDQLSADARSLIKILREFFDEPPCAIDPKTKHCFKHVVHGDAMQKGGMRCIICDEPMRKVVQYVCCNEEED